MGVPLALALLAILLHKHNRKIEDQTERQPLSIPTLLPIEVPRTIFGVVPKEGATGSDWLSFADARTSDFLDISFQDAQFKVILDEKVLEYVSLDSGLKILRNAMCSTEVAQAMKKWSSKSPLFNFYMIPFMSPILSLFFHGQSGSAGTEADRRLLKRNQAINSFGLKLIPICGDGNCCFASVAFNLISMKDTLQQHNMNYFTEHGLIFTDDIQYLAQQLRILAVKEWKENANFYESFLVDVDISSEADAFLQSSVFNGSLGDSMIVALSNALELPFIVFTTLQYHPILNQTPRNQAVPLPVFLAHTHLGVGHYDALVFADKESSISSVSDSNSVNSVSNSSCTCGKNDKLNKNHCVSTTSKYGSVITQCPCLSSGKGCNRECKCKRCDNPKGASSTSSSPPKRKRYKHDWQISVPKSADFLMMTEECISAGSVTVLEYFVLEYIIQYCSQE